MSFGSKESNKGSAIKPNIIFRIFSVSAAVLFIFTAAVFSQQPGPSPVQTSLKISSTDFISPDGITVDRLIELGNSRRADLLAARQRLAIAEGRLLQVSLRPNPTFDTEYGSPRFLGGEAESDFAVRVSQTFELGGKRPRRIALAELELNKTRAEVLVFERQIAVEIRTTYTNALASARQVDVLEKLIAADEEIVRVTEARLKEGDVAPLDVNLVKVEADRLRVQVIQAKRDLETQLLQLKTMIGMDIAESIRLAPQSERPPRFDIRLNELTELALKQRADLQASRLGEEAGQARIDLARANAIPNVAASVKYSRNKQIIDFPSLIGGNTINRDNALTFGVSVDIPIFNRNQGEIASATGEQIQATRQREFLETTIRRDVAVAYRKYRAAAETLVIYSTQILPRSEENLRTVRAAYGFGDFSVFEVIAEQRRLTENVTGYNQSLRDYYAALAELEAAIGATLPPTGFSAMPNSVLPNGEDVPIQIDREKFLKSIQTFELPKKSILLNAEIKKDQ
jgi:cobalt-zinc-cadmium efflux system outer membrane protein